MGTKVIVVWGCEIKQMMDDELSAIGIVDNFVYEIIK